MSRITEAAIFKGVPDPGTLERGSPEYWAAKKKRNNIATFAGLILPPSNWLSVTLDDTERRIGTFIGKERQRRAVADGRQDKFGTGPEEAERSHILGACGEMAFAKATGRYWGMGIDTFQVGDVGDFEVRTRSNIGYDLKVRKDETSKRVVVLVYGCCDLADIGSAMSVPVFRFFVAGYIQAEHAKQAKYELDKDGFRDAYLIPKADLRTPHVLIVRDWIKHYITEMKAPKPCPQSYNDYTGGDYYPPDPLKNVKQQAAEELIVPTDKRESEYNKALKASEENKKVGGFV